MITRYFYEIMFLILGKHIDNSQNIFENINILVVFVVHINILFQDLKSSTYIHLPASYFTLRSPCQYPCFIISLFNLHLFMPRICFAHHIPSLILT